MQRIVGAENAITLVQQFSQLHGYLEHWLLPIDKKLLHNFLDKTLSYVFDLLKPIFMYHSAHNKSPKCVVSWPKWNGT